MELQVTQLRETENGTPFQALAGWPVFSAGRGSPRLRPTAPCLTSTLVSLTHLEIGSFVGRSFPCLQKGPERTQVSRKPKLLQCKQGGLLTCPYFTKTHDHVNSRVVHSPGLGRGRESGWGPGARSSLASQHIPAGPEVLPGKEAEMQPHTDAARGRHLLT